LGRQTRRVIFFVLAILVGLTAGMVYGWEVNPIRFSEMPPDMLRIDYRADVVLMIAELYQVEGDAEKALTRLDFLGDMPTLEMMDEAIRFAEIHNYTPEDMQAMWRLASAIETYLPKMR
jgi:hypothetical protein